MWSVGVRQSTCQEDYVGFFDDRRNFPGCSSVESPDSTLYQQAVVPDVVAGQVRFGQVERPSRTAHEAPPAVDGVFERLDRKAAFGLEPGRLAPRMG
jgi:hypothetical protein